MVSGRNKDIMQSSMPRAPIENSEVKTQCVNQRVGGLRIKQKRKLLCVSFGGAMFVLSVENYRRNMAAVSEGYRAQEFEIDLGDLYKDPRSLWSSYPGV